METRAIIVFAFQILTYRGRISKAFMKHAHACIFTSDNKPKLQRIHFDHGFNVLFYNGANVSIGIHEDDFIYLVKKPGSVSGVGTANKAEGIGTIHWKLQTDNGQYLDVYIENALYIPTMDLRIVSVAQWGKQRT